MNNLFILFLILLIFYCACGTVDNEKFINLPGKWKNYYNCKRNHYLQQGISDKITDNKCVLNDDFKLDNISTKDLPYFVKELPLDEAKKYVSYNINPFDIYKLNYDNKFYKKMSKINQCKEYPFRTALQNNFNKISCNKLY